MSNSSTLLVREEKTSYLDQDHLWKKVITELFEPFMLFFAPDLFEKLDWSKQPDSLEQEFHRAFPEKYGSSFTDKLMKVHLKDGKEQWILVHIEVQGDGTTEGKFSKRMFQYFYRIFDTYDEKIYAIALLTDSRKSFEPTPFEYDFHGTNLTYTFNTYKLLGQDEAELLESNNPFALAVLAGIYMIQSRNNASLRYQFKRRLLELLLREDQGWKPTQQDVFSLFYFIDFLLEVPDAMNEKLENEITPIFNKEAAQMEKTVDPIPPTLRGILEKKKEEGKEEGKMEGKSQRTEEIAEVMMKKGFSFEQITEVTGLGPTALDEIKRRGK